MQEKQRVRWNLTMNWPLYLMLLPAAVLVIVFCYMPMYGVVVAFQNYTPIKGFMGSEFVGLKYFKQLFDNPDIWQIIFNTVYMAVAKIVFGTAFAIAFALLLNEVKNVAYKRTVQTFAYLPHFLSWVIIGGVFIDMLSGNGIVNLLLSALGFDKVMFLGSNQYFRITMIVTDIWKSFGWGSIIFISALTGINPDLYESAMIDGANRLKQTRYITLPGIMPTIVLVSCLNLSGILNAGFEQILVMYNPSVYETGDILDTFLYRTGLLEAKFSLATATGIMRSAIGFVLMFLSYKLANRFAGYTIF